MIYFNPPRAQADAAEEHDDTKEELVEEVRTRGQPLEHGNDVHNNGTGCCILR